MVQTLLDRYVIEPLAMLRTRTAREAGTVMSGTLTSAVLRFVITLTLAKLLDPTAWGTMVVFMALVDILAIVCDSGLHPTTVRFMAINEKRNSRPIVAYCLKLKFVLSAAVAVLLCFGYPLFIRFEKIEYGYRWLFPMAVAAGLFLSFNTFCMSVLQGRKRFGRYAVAAVLINVIRVAGIGTLVYIGAKAASAYFGVFFVAPAAATVVSAAICWAMLAGESKMPDSVWQPAAILRFAAPLALLQILTILYSRTDIFMLKAMADAESTGAYALGYQIAYIFPLLTQALLTALLPKVMAMRTAAELAVYRRKVLKLYPFVLAGAAVAASVAPIIVTLVFRDKYVSATPVIRIIILGFGASLVVSPLSLIFYALERQAVYVAIYAIQFVMLIAMNLLLIPRFGAVGAAVTAAVTAIAGTVAVVFVTGRMLAVQPQT